MRWVFLAVLLGCSAASAGASGPPGAPGDDAAAERGKEALFTRCFSAPLVTRAAYEKLWQQWGLKQRPDDFDAQVRTRYGLHEPSYPNDNLPMGLRPRTGRVESVGIDCMLCHGGSIFGKSYVGLPNTSLDLAGLFRDLDVANGGFGIFPYRLSHVRGTTEATATGVFVISLRKPDLSYSLPPANLGPIPDQAVEDTPAWWLLKRKETMYYNGQIDARAVRPLMTFMLHPFADGSVFAREEATFADIQKYLLTTEPPKYPLAVDAELAATGKVVFEQNCAKCHGTYGPRAAGDVRGDYPNKVVPLDKIGTDPSLVRGLTPKIEEHFRKSWFTQERGPGGQGFELKYNTGYQAPPLDGVWATAPYLHNGSVPTLHHLLKSDERPKVFTRSYRTGVEDYDAQRVGWKVTELAESPRGVSPREVRQVYDTGKPGRGNAGHTYGDSLSDDERRAVIEYLKTL